jgi:hypothetical protein
MANLENGAPVWMNLGTGVSHSILHADALLGPKGKVNNKPESINNPSGRNKLRHFEAGDGHMVNDEVPVDIIDRLIKYGC